jgi:sporulation integral membrane protein YtvI
MALLLTLLFSLLTLSVNRIVYEAEELLDWLASDSARLGSAVAEFFNKITSFGDRPIPLIENLMKVEQFRQFWENIDVVISDMISEAVSSLTRSIPAGVIHVISKLPSTILFVVITIISAFYFSLDLGAINSAIASLFPSKIREKIPSFKKKLFGTAAKYVRAYLLLLFLTFFELFVGFSILKISYPLLLALLIAIVDILPILGVGAALVPWGLVEILLFKDIFTGVGLLIIYVIVAIIRQITEPKVVAGSLGLHPLLTLAAMYIGLKVFGILGMILGPLLILALRPILKKPPLSPSNSLTQS